MKYAFLLRGDEAEWAGREPKIAEHRALERKLEAAGQFVDGSALWPKAEARTIRRHGDEFVVTDGPYAETREQLGGFYLIEADSMEQALALAREAPAPEGSDAYEVRPALTGAQWRGSLRGKHKYMLFFVATPERLARQTRDDLIRSIDLHYELSLELAAQGRFAASRALGNGAGAKTLRAGKGETIVTDGPFAECKELVAGYFIVACDSKGEAVEIAKPLLFGLDAVEVRPVLEKPYS